MAISLTLNTKLVHPATGAKMTVTQPAQAGHQLIGSIWEARKEPATINGMPIGNNAWLVTPEALEKAGWRNV